MNSVDLSQFTDSQIRFIEARLICRSDKEAAEMVGISPATAYNWKEKDEINAAVNKLNLSELKTTRERMYRLLPKAIDALEQELDDKEKSRAYVVFNLLDRVGLGTKQQLEVSGEINVTTLTDEERALRLKALLGE